MNINVSNEKLKETGLSKHDVNIYLGAVLALTFCAYSSCLSNHFVNWDDLPYVVDNILIKKINFTNLKNIFSQYTFGNYHPLTLISLAIDYRIGKLNPVIYHLTNVLLHMGNTYLVFRLLNSLTQRPEIAIYSAVLFGIHPIHTESVAWVAERKDVLYVFFFIGSLISYVKYRKKKTTKYYLLALFFFVLSSLSKGMAVSLPPVLLAIDLFMNEKITEKKIWLEKIPFFLLAILFGIVAIAAQHASNSIATSSPWTFFERLLLAGFAFFEYIFKLIIPHQLSPLYPYPEKINGYLPIGIWLMAVVSLLIILSSFLLFRNTKDIIAKYCLFGFAFFVITVFPVLQLLPVGRFIMADRYAYLPSIGFSFIIASLFYLVTKTKKKLSLIIYSLSAVYVFILAFTTYFQGKIWHDDISLWSQSVKYFPEYPESYQMRGNAQVILKNYNEAVKDYNKVIKMYPANELGYFLRAKCYSSQKKYTEAINDFNKVFEIMQRSGSKNKIYNLVADTKNNKSVIYLNRAVAYFQNGNTHQAFSDFKIAKELDSSNGEIYLNIGMAEISLKKYEPAFQSITKAINLSPQLAGEAYMKRGYIYYLMNNYQKSQEECSKAIEKGWIKDETYLTRGMAFVQLRYYDKAIADFDMAISLNPNSAEAYYNRGYIRLNTNDQGNGCQDLSKSKQLGYADAEALVKQFCN